MSFVWSVLFSLLHFILCCMCVCHMFNKVLTNLLGSNFNHCDVIGPKATKFGEIMQNNGHYTVQGHSRLPLSVPFKSQYAPFHVWLTVTYLPSCTVSEIWQIICLILAVDRGYLSSTHSFGWTSEDVTVKSSDIHLLLSSILLSLLSILLSLLLLLLYCVTLQLGQSCAAVQETSSRMRIPTTSLSATSMQTRRQWFTGWRMAQTWRWLTTFRLLIRARCGFRDCCRRMPECTSAWLLQGRWEAYRLLPSLLCRPQVCYKRLG